MAGLIVLLLGGWLYILPGIIGRHKRNASAIWVLTILGGWTGVGWVAALVWACCHEEPKPAA